MIPVSPSASASRTGVLLVNLGTPDAPTPTAIRRYLREFLSDTRVVEFPRLLWLPVLYGIVLPLRPMRLAHAYQSVWTERGSPLLAISQDQRDALQRALGDGITVALAMRYGNPSIESALQALEAQGIRRLLVLPLYPQYSATTTASVFDAVYAQLMTRRYPPELRTLNTYHDEPAYIDALAASVRAHWQASGRGDHLLMSFHSIPLKYIELGDPYGAFCQQTADRLAQALSLTPDQWSIAYQSRVGRTPWLSPYTDNRVVELAGTGVRQLDVVCPGFSADCLETLEEIAQRYAADFCAAGGTALRYIPALNAEPAHIELLASLVRRHTAGWEAS